MGRFNEYLEAASLESRMSEEDRKKIARHRAEIAHLKSSGDDSHIKEDIRYEYSQIRAIENKYRTDDEKKRSQESKDRSSKKRFDKQMETRHNKVNDVVKKYNALSDADKAKETIIALKNFRVPNFGTSRSDHNKAKREHRGKTDQMVTEIMDAFDIKERPYTFKSKFNLVEKNASRDLSARSDDIEDLKEDGVDPIKCPAKLLAIMKKYDRYPIM